MKIIARITALGYFLLLGMQIQAQEANLVVFAPMGQHFYLSIDNKLQTAEPQKNVKITGLAEGNCFIKLEFWKDEFPAFKQSIRLEGGKETSFILKKENDRLVLEEYSSVPLAQVGESDNKQFQTSYSRTGRSRKEVAQVETTPDIHKRSIHADPMSKEALDAKRQGNFTIKEPADETANPPSKENKTAKTDEYPQRSEVISYKQEGDRIIKVRNITIKEVVEKSGRKFVKTRKETREEYTDYTCIPMSDEDFEAAMGYCQRAAAAPLQNAVSQFKDKCLNNEQAGKVAEYLNNDNLPSFIATTNVQCAETKDCPLATQEAPQANVEIPSEEEPEEVVEEAPEAPKEVVEVITETEKVVEEKEPEVPKSAKELKKELKAAKKREKAERKRLKKEAKQKKKK